MTDAVDITMPATPELLASLALAHRREFAATRKRKYRIIQRRYEREIIRLARQLLTRLDTDKGTGK
jgi:hypothetical protein